MPKRRGNAGVRALRGRQPVVEAENKEVLKITLESIKSQLLEIEAFYSQTMGDMEREWGEEK